MRDSKVVRQPLRSEEPSSRVWALNTSSPPMLSQKLIPKHASMAGSTLPAVLMETHPYIRAVPGKKFDTSLLQRHYKGLARFGPATNSSLSGLQSFYCSDRYP
jgi:hypothetical protein